MIGIITMRLSLSPIIFMLIVRFQKHSRAYATI